MSDNNARTIEHTRHSLAHLLGAAVMELYPDAQLTLGPAVDDGFYYDIKFSATVGTNELPSIEARMRTLLPEWTTVTHKEVTKEEALEHFKGNQFKEELINEIAERGETITLYTMGSGTAAFTDLCRGGHTDDLSTIDPDSFKLDRVAGAYWRGSEKNPMLTRIYGLAFETKDALLAHIHMKEAAIARDHRKIGTELDLFTFSPLVGSGLPLWTPRGTAVRMALNDFVWDLRRDRGYEQVTIPHITKKDLYEVSGHWQKFADELFRINTREGKEFAMKPMNCPHHTQIYAHLQRSYRDLPQRYAETTMVYRDEQSGELGGLTRVLSITQDDAHVFCRSNQIEQEFDAIWEVITTFYSTFGFELRVRLSFHDPEEFDKYLGTKEVWATAEETLKKIAEGKGVEYFIGVGEAAMYGPKLDFMAKDSLGREHQVATVQLDMNLPERFDLFCINEKSEKERIVMIHCAIMGSIERFTAVLLEHTAGVLPVFCSPLQVTVVPVSDAQQAYAQTVVDRLFEKRIRVLLKTEDSLGKRIRASKQELTPYQIVIGAKEMESGMLTVETRTLKLENITLDDFITRITAEIKDRKDI